MLHPVKIATLKPELVARISARAVQMQGCPEARYHILSAQAREGFERGTYCVLAALESLGFTLLVEGELSPVLEVPE